MTFFCGAKKKNITCQVLDTLWEWNFFQVIWLVFLVILVKALFMGGPALQCICVWGRQWEMASMKVYHIGVSMCIMAAVSFSALARLLFQWFMLSEGVGRVPGSKEARWWSKRGLLGPGRCDRTGHRASLISLADACSDGLCTSNTSRLLSIVMFSA